MIAARPADLNPPPQVMAVARFERLFRRAADKADLRHYSDFVNRKLHQSGAIEGRKAIGPFHLPITKGLQDCHLGIH
jgi:hypothetical protein